MTTNCRAAGPPAGISTERPMVADGSTPAQDVAWRPRGVAAAWSLGYSAMMTEVGQLLAVPLYAGMIIDLHLSAGTVTWALLITSVVGAATIAAISRAGDLWGPKRVLVVTYALVTIGYVIASVAPNFGVLVAGRALVGLNAASALAIAIIGNRMNLENQKRAVGVLSGALAVAVFGGFFLGGLLLQLGANWRLAFGIAGIMSFICLLALVIFVPEAVTGPQQKRSLDVPSIVLLGGGLAAVSTGLSEGGTWGWGSSATVGCIAGGVVGIVAWVIWGYRAKDPLVDSRLVISRRLGPVYLMWAVIGCCAYFMYQLLLGYAETPSKGTGYGFGLNYLEGSLLLLPVIITGLITARMTQVLLRRGLSPKTIMLVCTVIFAVGFLWLWLLHGAVWEAVVGVTLYGIALTPLVGATLSILAAEIPPDRPSGASSVYLVLGSAGAAIGTAIYAAIVDTLTIPGTSTPTAGAYSRGFLIVFLIAVVGIVLACILPGNTRAADDATVG